MGNNYLDISSWKKFKIDDLFVLNTGDERKNKNPIGTIPLITTGTKNNGISEYISINGKEPFPENSITVSNIDSEAIFFQKSKTYLTQNVFHLRLKNKDLNKELALFLIPIIKKSKDTFGWGNYIGKQGLLDLEILLPVTKNKSPDFQFMESYILKIFKNLKYENIQNKIKSIKKIENQNLNVKKWKEFNINDVLTLETSKWTDPYLYKKGTIPYISRQTTNNGVKLFVEADESLLYKGNCITIGAESAMAFYQEKPFLTGEKIYRLKLKEEKFNNKNILLFLCVVLNKVGEKYLYHNMWSSTKIKKDKILLPIDDNGEPDYLFMEEYIKNIDKFINKG